MNRVLVVDDDFMVARVHCGFVQRVPGFVVVGTAHTGVDALAAAAELRPDLILLDIYLPDMSGLEVLRHLREEGNQAHVLVITAARDADTIRTALRHGIIHYMIKPFSFDALRDRLELCFTTLTRLEAKPEVHQSDVDRLFGTTSRRDAAMPKGLTNITAQLVIDVLRGCPTDLSASECATQAGLSRASTRRYLEYLVACGKAEIRMRYGGTGRPEHRYSWIR